MRSKESCLKLLDQLKYLTSSKEKIKSSLDVIVNILMIVCENFDGKVKKTSEQNVKKLTTQIKNKNMVTNRDKFELANLIKFMKKNIITDKAGPSSNVSKYIKNLKFYFTVLSHTYKKLDRLKQFKSGVCYLLSALLSSICNQNILLALKSLFDNTSEENVPWIDSLKMINELFNTKYTPDVHCCFHQEASKLLYLYAQDRCLLSKFLYKGTITIGQRIGKKILKNAILCCEDPNVHCDLLIKLINFVIKMDKRMCEQQVKEFTVHTECEEYSKCDIQKCSPQQDVIDVLSENFIKPNSEESSEDEDEDDQKTGTHSGIVWSLLCKVMKHWTLLKQKHLFRTKQKEELKPVQSKVKASCKKQLRSLTQSKSKNLQNRRRKSCRTTSYNTRSCKRCCTRFQNKHMDDLPSGMNLNNSITTINTSSEVDDTSSTDIQRNNNDSKQKTKNVNRRIGKDHIDISIEKLEKYRRLSSEKSSELLNNY